MTKSRACHAAGRRPGTCPARWRRLLGGLAALLGLVPAASLAAQEAGVGGVSTELEWRVERLRAVGSLPVREGVVWRRELTLAVYERRGFSPLWTDRAAVQGLLRAIEAVREDGLNPEDYNLSTLAEIGVRSRDASAQAERDLLSTDAFVRISYDLRFGKVEPQEPVGSSEAVWLFGGPSAVANVVHVVASGRIEEALAELRPQHFVYRGLVAALAELRRVRSQGGWEKIPSGPILGLDSVDARVPALRRRLLGRRGPGYERADAGLRFDTVLQATVEAFQHVHGLNEDGRVGPATLAALNVSVDQRIDQVRVNLERARWIARTLPDTFVAVNVAGAKVYVMQGDRVVFEARAIVGKGYTQTPVFTAPMLYVDLNPTWTVPPGIVGEVLAAVRRDPDYLESQRIRVMDGSGAAVDPAGIDFSRYTAADFPYVLRQDPGAANPLGRIKLMFPNEHSIYLHDTPSRHLFGEEERLFSHGCIRVEDPFGLAELVLGDPVRWNRRTLEDAIAAGVTRTIRLERPVPVLVLYWTAASDVQGEVHFYRDVYHRDEAILSALDGEVGSGTRAGEGR